MSAALKYIIFFYKITANIWEYKVAIIPILPIIYVCDKHDRFDLVSSTYSHTSIGGARVPDQEWHCLKACDKTGALTTDKTLL